MKIFCILFQVKPYKNFGQHRGEVRLKKISNNTDVASQFYKKKIDIFLFMLDSYNIAPIFYSAHFLYIYKFLGY